MVITSYLHLSKKNRQQIYTVAVIYTLATVLSAGRFALKDANKDKITNSIISVPLKDIEIIKLVILSSF